MLRHILRASLAVGLLAGPYSSPIYADDGDGGNVQALCNDVGMGDWGDKEKVFKKVEAMGFKPLRIKVEKGCWQVDALNSDRLRVEIYIHPTSGKTVMRKIKQKPVISAPSYNSN